MKTDKLKKLEQDWEFYDKYLHIQHEPYRYNGLIAGIVKNIELLESINKNLANNEDEEMKQRVSNLFKKYNNLRDKYFSNHPWRFRGNN